MIWIETPTNPLLKLVDLEAYRALAQRAGDPRCRQHLRNALPAAAARVGCDIVMHSATKFLNGHSDMVGGIVATARRCAGRAAGLPAELDRRGRGPVRQFPCAARA